jgi:hypothetical protein
MNDKEYGDIVASIAAKRRDELSYEKVLEKTNIICDIDGTIADLTHRLKYVRNLHDDPNWKADWDAFHKGCVLDAPKQDVIEVVNCTSNWGVRDVYYLSGRNSMVREETVAWLREHVLLCKDWDDHTFDKYLHMRRKKDRRPDTVIKAEMVAKLGLTPENTLCVFDDRQCVVDMWRELGFLVMQVDAWSE